MIHKKLYDLYLKNQYNGLFAMAVSHLLCIGFNDAQEITDEQIETINGNGLMTKEFCQDLVKLTRDIALVCENNPVSLIQFCMVEEIFDTQFYKCENGLEEEDEDE